MKKEQKNFSEQKKSIKEKMETVDAESAFILNACVQLSVFLNYHSTLVESDPFEKALILVIQKEEKILEEQKKSNKKDRDTLLCYTLAAICYEHMDNVKRAIERVQINTHAPLTVEEVGHSFSLPIVSSGTQIDFESDHAKNFWKTDSLGQTNVNILFCI